MTDTKPSKAANNTHLVESGILFTYVEPMIRRRMRPYLIEKHGHKCMICNTEEWCGKPIPLICDHIDGNSENNAIENFRNVCPNCDAQLPTYKSKNRGKGRKYDREYKRLSVTKT